MNSETRTPTHIAFIMDGNGRWAKRRGLPRSMGHKAGFEIIPDVLQFCFEQGVQVVSAYAWSTENWGRPKKEVGYVMRALEKNLLRFVDKLHEKGVRFVHSGTCERLSKRATGLLGEAVRKTAENGPHVFNLALNYGGRAELVHAARWLLAAGTSPELVTEELLARQLWTADLPDVDLVIRTGGDTRLSNFLLWQSAFATLFVVEEGWPGVKTADIVDGISLWRETKFNVETQRRREG